MEEESMRFTLTKSLDELNKRILALQLDKNAVQKALEDAEKCTDHVYRKMTKAERILATWKLPKLPESLAELINNSGYKTGSSVYSGANPVDEDWCVNLPPHVFKGYAINCTDEGYWEADGFTVVYAHYQGTLLNIICFSDIDMMKAWYYATHLMASLQYVPLPRLFQEPDKLEPLPYNLFNQKWKRVRVFRALKDIFYTPKPRRPPMILADAIKYSKCARCGQEAINFIDQEAKQKWQADGICDRCREA